MRNVPGKGRERPLIASPTEVGTRILVSTAVGPADAELARPVGTPTGLLVLGHGAGGSIDSPDLRVVTAAALDAGIAVARVRQPYLVAGRRAPAPAAQLDIAWAAVVEHLRGLLHAQWPELRVAVGGRSSGARVACRTAGATGVVGILALAFPLHPPGHPEKSRAPELEVDVPLLVLQGARDPFGGPDQFPAGVAVHEVAGADHRLAGPALAAAVGVAVDWLSATLASR
ncbi:MAG TPA: alpha/beta family hydrolase [Acidothermaceae bacterium]|nr:alpha/beta family hydrolase [Acidothermaceae bacterium]